MLFTGRVWRWTLAMVVALMVILQPRGPGHPDRPSEPLVGPIVFQSDRVMPLFAVSDHFDELLMDAPLTVTKSSSPGFAHRTQRPDSKSQITWMEVTAYCPCPICCGPRAAGVTASGKPVTYNNGFFIAADVDRFAFGAKLRIPGYHDGEVVEVQDRGSAILGPRLDVFFPTHEQATAWGRRWLAVSVIDAQ